MYLSQSHRGKATASLLFSLLFVASAPAVSSSPAPWPPELGRAFELYYSGEYAETQSLCRRMSAEFRDKAMRREIAALDAMATMRIAGRDNRLEGQTRLSQLAEEDDSLLDRPECRLAYGIADTSMYATASALHHLNEAAKGFERQGRSDRLAETLAALAEAWERHAEWELATPGLDSPKPRNSVEADAIRIERIRDLRKRASALPDAAAFVHEIDLTLARHLKGMDGGETEAIGLLKRLSGIPDMDVTAVRAALLLAEKYEDAHNWADALELYERAFKADVGELSNLAEERLRAIQEPGLKLSAPSQVSPGKTFALELETRGLSRVEVELRRIDLIEWLTQRQGRLDEAALPVSGAVVAVREVFPVTEQSYDVWRSGESDDLLRFEAPIGAFAAVANATTESGRTLTAKRLIIAGGLTAYAFSGRDNLTVWLPGYEETVPDAEALIWMRGSFVPRRTKLEGNVAVFPFPPEARMLRDKRWTCAIKAREQVYLCQGELSAKHKVDRLPSAVLAAGPSIAGVGETYHLYGVLLDAPDGSYVTREAELRLLGSSEETLYECKVPLSPAGTFSKHVRIEPSMANTTMHAVVQLDGRILDQVYSSSTVRVSRLDMSPARLRIDAPDWLTADEQFPVRISADYPWGTRLSWVRGKTAFLPVVLPDNDLDSAAYYSSRRGRHHYMGDKGVLEFTESTDGYELPQGPRAIGQWGVFYTPDGRDAAADAATLIGPKPVHMWLEIEEDVLEVGAPLHFQVHWFDPGGRTAGTRPHLTIYREGVQVATPQLSSFHDFMRSWTWRPGAAGDYEAVAEFESPDLGPLIVRKSFTVLESPIAANDANLKRITACRISEADLVSVHLEGAASALMLVLLDAGDPVTALEVVGLAGKMDVLLPTCGKDLKADMQVAAFVAGESGAYAAGVAEVASAWRGDSELKLTTLGSELLPGSDLRVAIEHLAKENSPSDARVMMRLADLTDSGGVRWLPGKVRTDIFQRSDGLRHTSSRTERDASDASPVVQETRELSSQLTRLLFEGETTWINETPLQNGFAAVTAAIPDSPGYYRLTVALTTPKGERIIETRDWDLRRGVRASADMPEHWQSGDQTNAVLEIENDTDRRAEFRISFDGGSCLTASDWRTLQSSEGVQSVSYGESPALILAPGGRGMLQLKLEATAVGADRAAFTVDSDGEQRGLTVDYVVQEKRREAEDADSLIRVQRKFYRLQETPGPVARAEAGGPSEPINSGSVWERTLIDSGEAVQIGEMILVEESFTLDESLSSVVWRQRMPANCFTHSEEWDEFRRIGVRWSPRLQLLEYYAAGLPAGKSFMHEYVITPVRPGSCIMPPPILSMDGDSPSIVVVPDDCRIMVDEQ